MDRLLLVLLVICAMMSPVLMQTAETDEQTEEADDVAIEMGGYIKINGEVVYPTNKLPRPTTLPNVVSTSQPPKPTTRLAPNECKNYKMLNTRDRAQGVPRGNVLKCDKNDLSKGWYRFSGEAGSAMSTSCVPKNRCGTHAPGWMEGSHPTSAQGIVTRKVCYHWNNKCCNWHNMIRVRNCGGFYVYELDKTPMCHLRYCGNAEVIATTQPPRPTTLIQAPKECKNYKMLNTRDRAQGVPRGNVLKCDKNDLSKGWYRFSGEAGSAISTSCVPKNRCGTHAPGWMEGSHPTPAQGIVTRKVCYHWGSKCCNWHNMIRVRNCGGFYLYELDKTPVCNLRYCGNAGVIPTIKSISADSIWQEQEFELP